MELETNTPAASHGIDFEQKNVKPLKASLSKACFDLAADLPAMMRHWPKTTRMGLGRKLEEHTYQLLDSAVVVSNLIVKTETKLNTLQDMSSGTDIVLVYLRLAYFGKGIDGKRYQRMSTQVVDIGKQVGGLKRYLSKGTRISSHVNSGQKGD